MKELSYVAERQVKKTSLKGEIKDLLAKLVNAL